MLKKILGLACLIMWSGKALAAVGCDLNDPDRDVKHFFPNSTGYKTEYLSVEKVGGEALYQKMEQQLGDKFSGIYEKIDVPYTVYTILQNGEPAGYIHGVNQKGKFGGMQVFLILDTKGNIQNFYFQKLTSKQAAQLRSAEFGKQFIGLNLGDFREYDVAAHTFPQASKLARIKNPVPSETEDFYAALRGVKKNLILMDNFIFKRGKIVK